MREMKKSKVDIKAQLLKCQCPLGGFKQFRLSLLKKCAFEQNFKDMAFCIKQKYKKLIIMISLGRGLSCFSISFSYYTSV